WIHTYMDTVKKQTDVEPIIYTGHFARESCFDYSITKYDLWFSQYSSTPVTGIWPSWDFWQYSDNGRVDGIGGVSTPVDLDVLNGPESDLDKYIIHKPSIVGTLVFPANPSAEQQVLLDYTIKNPYPYTFDTVLAAQVKKSGSKDPWIDISGMTVSDNEIINIIPGTHWYTKKFTIPTSVVPGTYDVKFIIINSENGNWIDSSVMSNALTVAPPQPLGSTITVVSPNSGENWESGSQHEIKWIYTGNPGDYVDIELLKNGVVVSGIGASVLTSAGSITLTMPNTPGEDYKIRITGVKDGVHTAYSDISDGYFAIDGQIVMIISPNGGENLLQGTEHKIQWTFIRKPITAVKIELQKGPFVLPELLTSYAPTNDKNMGLFIWNIPETQEIRNDYKITITGIFDPTAIDTSDGYFSIQGFCSMYSMSSSSLKTSAISTDPCTPPPPATPMLDLVILVDTTSSMWDDIDAVKASASEIVQAIDLEGFDSRVAIADYRDIPQSPFGGSMDYPYNLNLPFSNNTDSIINSINGLSLGWGADTPESVYTALVHTMEDPNKDLANSANSGWRFGATKAIIIMGDAPPHTPVELWPGGHSLPDVISTSASIDPVIVYSIVIGSDPSTYEAFSAISSGTNGRVYSSPQASDVVAAIIEAIGDIGASENRGVLVNITPSINETVAGKSAGYTVNVTNIGNLNDVYNISLELNNFVGFQRGYPVAIQPSWVNFNSAQVTLDPGMSEIRPLKISVPVNWAGMEDVIYSFNVTATSTTNASIGNTSLAELKVKADKRSMAEYSKLEIQWLRTMIQGSKIDNGIKNALLSKLTNAESKVDTAIANVGNGKFGSNLNTAENMMIAFNNQVEAQYDKKIMQPDAAQIKEKASQIIVDLEKAKNSYGTVTMTPH
ncbi:hypothetical protein L6260_02505, partial [Candidatus Parcubacteria bacterium]|nr:hypothetical protein [Candidatus Parcubacteria bacterium]